jgi:hypothetical protein
MLRPIARVIIYYLMQKVLADITHGDNGLWFLTRLSSTPVLDSERRRGTLRRRPASENLHNSRPFSLAARAESRQSVVEATNCPFRRYFAATVSPRALEAAGSFTGSV